MSASVPNLVWGEGPTPCPAMLIGEAPGANEERLGRPFVGVSGELLDEALGRAGTTRDRVFVTNVYKLRPPQNRNPTQAEIDEHWPYLQDEIRRVRPLFLLLLGNIAFHTFFPNHGGITLHHGEWIEGRAARWLPVYHPSFVRRFPSAERDFFADVAEFVRVVDEFDHS